MTRKEKKQSTRGGARPGAGRKPIYQQLGPPISVRLEKDLQDRLDVKCERLGISRTAGLQQAVARWVKTQR